MAASSPATVDERHTVVGPQVLRALDHVQDLDFLVYRQTHRAQGLHAQRTDRQLLNVIWPAGEGGRNLEVE